MTSNENQKSITLLTAAKFEPSSQGRIAATRDIWTAIDKMYTQNSILACEVHFKRVHANVTKC